MLTFSVPAYIAAVVVGSCTMATFLAATRVHSTDGLFVLLGICLSAGVVAALPAMLVFLPATLLSFWLANRFGWRSSVQFGLLGAMSAVGTAGVLSFLSFLPAGKFDDPQNVVVNATLAFAFAGVLAALTYRWLDLLSRRKQETSH